MLPKGSALGSASLVINWHEVRICNIDLQIIENSLAFWSGAWKKKKWEDWGQGVCE